MCIRDRYLMSLPISDTFFSSNKAVFSLAQHLSLIHIYIGQHKNNLAVLIEEVNHVKGVDFLSKEQLNRMQSDDSQGEN